MSARLRPLLSRALRVAGIGAVSMMTGSSAASTAVCTRATGVRPSSAAFSLVVISSAAAPSLICELLPAWITPSGRNAGLSLAMLSSVPPRRTPSSVSTTVPSSSFTGAICPANRPSSIAAAAFCVRGERELVELRRGTGPSARRSSRRRSPGSARPRRRRSRRPEPDGFGQDARSGPSAPMEPIGTRLIDSTPPATTTSYWPLTRPAAAKCTDCWLEPHCRSTVTPGTRLRPAGGEHGVAGDVEGLLADLADAAPDHVVDLGRVGQACALGERVEHVRRQVHRVDPASAPFRFPTGVRTAATITASRIAPPPSPRRSPTYLPTMPDGFAELRAETG